MFLQNLRTQMLGYTVLTCQSKVTSIVCPRLAFNKKLHFCSELNYALFSSYKLKCNTLRSGDWIGPSFQEPIQSPERSVSNVNTYDGKSP
jgi:hypothetical protein